MCSNVGFGASTVAMNSYIPSLAKAAPEVVGLLTEYQNASRAGDLDADTSTENPSAPLLANSNRGGLTALEKDYQLELSRATSRISSLGIALGYGAGICLLIIALVPVTSLKGSTYSLRLAIGLSGIWWMVFTIPSAIWLPVSNPPYIRNGRVETTESDEKNFAFWREIGAAWLRLGNMLRWSEIKKLRNTFKYLAAWFLLSDGELRTLIQHGVLTRMQDSQQLPRLPSSLERQHYTCHRQHSSSSEF